MDIGAQDPRVTNGAETATLAQATADAEALLRYASQSGIDLPQETVATLVRARAEAEAGRVSAETTIAFYAAYAKLAARLRPVTTETLRVPEAETRAALRRNGIVAVALAVAVVACSMVTFMTTSMTGDIETGINHANELAVRLHDQVGPPKTAIPASAICESPATAPDPPIDGIAAANLTPELQDLAATIRGLNTEAIKLNFFVLKWEVSPLDTPVGDSPWKLRPRQMLQLNPELLDPRMEAFCKIYAYEDVRDFAKNVRADTLAIYGAIAAYFLPVLYALLGAYAFNLRDFSRRVRQRTYHPSSSAVAARTIAAITAGAIISLFNSLSQGTALPPLAIAFLVGYGVEAFFAFLDTLLAAFRGNRPNGSAPARP